MSITLNDTIAALATPMGVGGIAVLRLSGPRAWEIAQTLATPPNLPASDGPSRSPSVHGGTEGGLGFGEGQRLSWKDTEAKTWAQAQELRRNLTEAEKRLWQALRHGQVGVDFRRQHPLGPFIADFYSHEARFVVEVDGDTHADPEQRAYDEERTRFFAEHGLRVKRYANREVLKDLRSVLEDIRSTVKAPPNPPAGGGGPDAANTAHFARILDDDGSLVDEVVVTFFREPRSYTGEDVAEISCHGGRYAAARILQMILAGGARMARPGEFTERAFLNGKLDLAQAEAIAGLIHARTERAGRAAARQLAGGLSEKVRGMRSRILDLLALLELELDFSEEDVQFQTEASRRSTLSELEREMRALADTFQRGRLMREGVRVAIVGAPNAGKSTLLNALVEEERAIVSDEPGTTRDVVEARIELAGQEIILQDTAGVREATGRVESEGVARTRRAVEHADLVLLLLDVSDPHWPTDDVLRLLCERRVILVLSKMDLCPEALAEKRDLPRGLAPWAMCAVSALHKQGLEPLLEEVVRIVLGEETGKDEIIVAEARHHDSLVRGIASVERAREQLGEPTLMASDLRDAVNALGEITGETVGEEILERIFSKFCIGK